MNVRQLSELFSFRDVRNAVLALVVVFGGVGLAGLTYYAHLVGNARLAGLAAGASLIFVLLILIFVVPPLARNAGKEASQMNLPFEFTGGGAIMLGLMAIVGFSAWNTGNNLLFLVLSFMAAAIIVGFFAGGLCLKKLDVKMRFPETIFAGEETPILVSVTNRKRLFPSYSVVAEVRGKEREESIAAGDLRRILPAVVARRLARPPLLRRTLDYFVHIPRRQSVDSQSSHVFDNRGRLLIQDFELSTKFPFGFFRHRRRLPAKETELIVFPAIDPAGLDDNDLLVEAGRIFANKRGSGQDLLSLREYQPNDDLRRVDWKATARARHLIVREFAAEDDKRVSVYLDTRVPADSEKRISLREMIEAEHQGKNVVLSERFERGVRLAASLLSRFADEQAEIRLVIDEKAGEFGLGPRHLHECLKRLAVVQPRLIEAYTAANASETDAPETPANAHIIIVTALGEEALPPDLTREAEFVLF